MSTLTDKYMKATRLRWIGDLASTIGGVDGLAGHGGWQLSRRPAGTERIAL